MIHTDSTLSFHSLVSNLFAIFELKLWDFEPKFCGGFLTNCAVVSARSQSEQVGNHEGLAPVLTTRYHVALIRPLRRVVLCAGCVAASQFSVLAQTQLDSPPPPLCDQSLSDLYERLGQSLLSLRVNPDEPTASMIHDPSPGPRGAAPPLLIVLKSECYHDLISPGLPLAGGANVHSV